MSNNASVVFLAGLGFKPSIFPSFDLGTLKYEAKLIDYTGYISSPTDEMILQINQQIPDDSIIIAWSLGGLLAINLCDQFPHKCKQLILITTSPKFLSEENWPGIPQQVADDFEYQAEHSYSQLIKTFTSLVQYPIRDLIIKRQLVANSFDTQDHEVFKILLHKLFTVDNRNHFSKLSVPVLHIFGEQDAIMPLATLEHLTAPSNYQAVMIANAGHVPFLSHKEEFEDIVTRWLQYGKH